MVSRALWFDLLWKLCLVSVILNSLNVLGKRAKTSKSKHWKAPRPHIIMIVADDLGWDDVSFHGSPQIPTPHIDKLANEGVILNSYYVSPICTPTRASIMTGKHPVNLGIQHATIFGTQPYGLPLGEATAPQYLKALGYRTHGVGKWHLGFFEKEYTPLYRGFESYYGFWNGKEDYWDHTSLEDVWGTDLRNDMEPVKNESGHYGTELYTEIAERIIDTHNKSEPLYLYLAQQAVHSANEQDPLQAPKRLLDKLPRFSSDERKMYAAMVASLDESVGNITKALKRTGLYDNSVIVFTTDNGGAPRGFNWNQGCNFPFKGGKDTFWEGGVRGVGFVHSKLIKKKGRVSYDLIDVTDWLPTFYHLAGGDVTAIQDKIDGMNQWDTIAHGKKSPRTEVLHNIDPIRKFAAIRMKQYKLIINQDAVFKTTWHPRYSFTEELDGDQQPSTLPGAVIKCGKWDKSEAASCDTDIFPCLFNIEEDPCEYNNIAHSNLDIVQKLLHRLIKYQKNARPLWFPDRDPEGDPAYHTGSNKGYWAPWMESETNEKILKKVLDNIAVISGKRHHKECPPMDNVTVIEKEHSTHAEYDKDVYYMLKGILHQANKGKKGLIPKKFNVLMKESLAMLYSKMKHKARADNLMHKLQLIKKAQVANGAKRNDIENLATSENNFSENADEDDMEMKSVSGDDEREIENVNTLDGSSDLEKQNNIKEVESVDGNHSKIEGESNIENDSSYKSDNIFSESSAEASSITNDADYENQQF